MDGGAAPDHGDEGRESPFPDVDYVSSNEEEEEAKLCPAESHYNDNGYGIKAVVAMSIGLLNVDNTGPLVDLTKPPWTTLAKKEVKLSVSDLRIEVGRRAPGDDGPRCANWTIGRLTKWLTEHPITLVDDVLFLRKIVQSTIDDCEVALEEGLVPVAAAADPCPLGQWRGNTPYLRLIMCLVADDAIRNAYLHRGDALSRTELDARNSEEVREPTVFEMLADKWNDASFTATVPVSTVHDDFRREIVIPHSKVRCISRQS
jgi:hypothetical protein